MRSDRYRRLLLLAGLLLPSVAIAWLGWNVVVQQDLIDTTATEQRLAHDDLERKNTIREIGNSLLARLNTIKLEWATRNPQASDGSNDPEVALVGWVEGENLVYPWDSKPVDGKATAYTRSIQQQDFAARIDAAVEIEYSDRPGVDDDIIEMYRQLIDKSPDFNQREHARYLLAAMLIRRGRAQDGYAVWRETLALPVDFVDDRGEPLAYNYAAVQLLKSGRPELAREVAARVEQEISGLSGLPYGERFIQPVLQRLSEFPDPQIGNRAAADRKRLAERTAYIRRMKAWEQARTLQNAFRSLRVTPERWRRFSGEETWLVGMTPAREGPSLVIAVRSDAVRKRVAQERSQPFELASAGESLGDSFPDLRARMPGAAFAPAVIPSTPLQRRFAAQAAAIVIVLSTLGIYMVWRDTRRELRLANLRSQFVSHVSHELKTPLTAIRMFAELMQLQGPGDPKKHSQHLETIVSESERLTRLLNNVLDFSRIERGERTYNLQPADLPEIVRAAARVMQHPLTQRGFDFQIEIGDNIPRVRIDHDAIEQAILNLLGNAMKYSDERRSIALRLAAEGGDVLIQVTDQGVGIAPRDLQRIFERYYRAATPLNRAVSGTGLGLALVAHIVNAHGGRVDVESTPGKGSTFTIRIPIHERHGT